MSDAASMEAGGVVGDVHTDSRPIVSINAPRRRWHWRDFLRLREQEDEPTPFTQLMAFAHEVAAQNPVALVDVVRLYLRPLQAELLVSAAIQAPHRARAPVAAETFFAPNAPLAAWPYHGDCPQLANDDFSVNLARDSVLPCPWKRDHYSEALTDIGTGKLKGEWRQDPNHRIVLLLPWGIPFVTSGNHSMAAGILAGEGAITPTEVWSLTSTLLSIHTNGSHYFDTATGAVVCQVTDPVRAAIFEVGRLMLTHGVVPMRKRREAEDFS